MYFSCNFSISSTLRHLHILIVDPVQCNFLLRLILCWNAVVVSTKKITLAFFLLYQHTYTKAFYIWWHFGGYEMGSLLVIRIPQYTCTIAYKKTRHFCKGKKKEIHTTTEIYKEILQSSFRAVPTEEEYNLGWSSS